MKDSSYSIPRAGLEPVVCPVSRDGDGDLFPKTAPYFVVYSKLASLLLLVGFLSLITPGNGHPVQTIDLSGTWDFRPLGQPQTTIQVPGGGWRKQGFSVAEADYKTTVSIPSIGKPQVTKLKFGAVNYQADLHIDGNLIESSTQSHTPATFDITDHTTPGNSHEIRLRVKGHNALMFNGRSLVPNGAGSWSPTLPDGIFRSAELLVYPEIHIEDVFVRTYATNTSLYYDVWLRNASSSSETVTLSGSLSSWNGDPWSYPSLPSQLVDLASDSVTKTTVGPVNWNLGPDSYWWPNVPYQSGYKAQLHNLHLSISGGGSHQAVVRFGFRECTQGPDGLGNTCYFLNGIRVNFRGDSLQGANYDRIDSRGQGNAYDTFSGFLPGLNGWPKAVDNYQRLNYNVVRIHQIPASPYMLDVCDEMGLMIINETGIRGAGDQQDFIVGHDNMVNHLKALFTRDRNHPSVVRLSLSNEPDWSSTDSTSFEIDLYNAAMSVDGTRPLSVDAGASDYEAMSYPNFSVYRHYGFGGDHGKYADEVHARPDRPYGCGEFIWPQDNTRKGLTWFATGTQAMRAKGASDIRPYTLLSAWASVIPGVQTTQMPLEVPPWDPTPLFPVYGEDNLPEPWSNPQIQRVQAGFNPVLVADRDYWEFNKFSNLNGDWPASIPFIGPTQAVTRTLTIYNDTFSGTAVDVFWELRQGSPTGPVIGSNVIHATVPLGYRKTQEFTFRTPMAPNGTKYFLVLSARKGDVEMFKEIDQQFLMFNQMQLTGNAFGTSPPWALGSEYDKASDGDRQTFFDYLHSDGGYTGIDLGVGNAKRISSIVFTPRAGFEYRMDGGVFQGSTDDVNYTTIYTVSGSPAGTTPVLVNTYQAYRYLRYVGPADSYCNIAEMEFYAATEGPLTGTAFGASPAWAPGSEYDKATDGNKDTFYDFASADGGYTGVDLGTNNAQKIGYIVFTPRANVNAWDNFQSRMFGGMFQGSNDGLSYTTIHTIDTVTSPANNVTVFVNTPVAYRYLRYVGPDSSYCNIAEMAFYSHALGPAEAWRLDHFGTIENSGNASNDADPDGDGVVNMLERAFWGNPNVRETGLHPGVDPSAPVLSIIYRKAKEASDLAVAVQECRDLVFNSWTTAIGTNTILSDDGTIQSNRFTAPVDAETKFLRVRVTQL